MGRGIAAVAVLAGYKKYVNDIDESQLSEAEEVFEWPYGKSVENGAATEAETDAAIYRLSFTTDLEEAVGNTDFVTEAAVEQQSVKGDIFENLVEIAPEDALLATNTPGLNITQLNVKAYHANITCEALAVVATTRWLQTTPYSSSRYRSSTKSSRTSAKRTGLRDISGAS